MRAVLLFVAALLLTSCALFVSFDGYDPYARFAVRGTVEGLESGTVAILVNAGARVDVGNGPFAIPDIADGTEYLVTTKDPEGQTCTVEHGSGTIHGADVTDVAVRCVSNDAKLARLSIEGVALAPAFSPDRFDYAADPFPVPVGGVAQAKLTAATRHPRAQVSIAGAPPSVAMSTQAVPIRLGPKPIDIMVTAPDGKTQTHYVVAMTGSTTATYIKASNTRSLADFGWSVALSGDTLAVGSPGESSNAKGVDGNQSDTSMSEAGAVYVFARAGSTWTQQAYIKASNTRGMEGNKPGARFGWSVALSGDTLVVGSPGESSNAKGIDGNQSDTSMTDAGAVYVFVRTGAKWAQQAYVKASNTRALALFGCAVAVSGDTLAVGSYGESSNAKGIDGNQGDTSLFQAGAVYLFTRAGTAWTQRAYVKASNSQDSGNFGTSVALSGDTLAVGAPYEAGGGKGVGADQNDTSAPDAGAVYVFRNSGTAWSQEAYVKASNTRDHARFGTSVAIDGDTLAVGSPAESSGASGIGGNESDTSVSDAGAAYVFARAGTTWTQQAYVKASNTHALMAFGDTVALSGDVLAVGATNERSKATGIGGDEGDRSAEGAGAAYVFRRSGAAWSQGAYVKATNTRAQALFGSSIAVSAGTLAVGSFLESSNATGVGGNAGDTSAMGSGAVYVY